MAKLTKQIIRIFNSLNTEKRFGISYACLKKLHQESNEQVEYINEFVSAGRFVPKTYDEYNKQQKLKPQQPASPRLLHVSIIGDPNAGKSTLTNRLLNWKVCSVSKKIHTTKYNTAVILIEGDTQVIFLDTPGLVTPQHGKKHNLDPSLVVDPENSLLQADIIAVIVDAAASKKLNAPLLKLLNKKKDKKSILILNKIDKLKSKSQLLEITRILTDGVVSGKVSSKETIKEIPKEPTLEQLFQNTEKKLQRVQNESISSDEQHNNDQRNEIPTERKGWPLFSRVFMISALDGDGVKQIRDYFLSSAYSSPWIYHNSIVTNQDPHEIAVLTVREKLLNFLPQEIPYQAKLAVEMWEETDDGLLNIVISIKCPRKGNVKLIIGPKGKTVSKIVDAARQDLADTFRCDISLKIIIKVDT